MNKKLVVIGGGAAGFFCAVNAARMHPQMQVTIIEKTSKLLEGQTVKIKFPTPNGFIYAPKQ